MRITGQHDLHGSREEVWRGLQDPRVLARALPGVKRLEQTGEHRYEMSLAVGIGSIKGSYDGVLRFAEQRPPESCQVHAAARGTPGSVDMVATMTLHEGANGMVGGTRLTYDAEANVTGALAGVGQRLVGAAARRTTEEFLNAVDRELAPAEVADAGRPVEATDAPRAPAAARPSAKVDRRLLLAWGSGALVGCGIALAGVAVGARIVRR